MIVQILVIVIILVLFLSWLNFYNDSKKINVPGPAPLPIFGNALLFLGDNSLFLRQVYNLKQKYGNAFRVYIMSTRYLVVSNPKYVEDVLSTNDHLDKGDAYKYLHEWLGQGLLTSTGQKWKSHRRLLTSAFHFNILQSFLPIFLNNQKILNTKLGELADKGEYFDLFPIMALAALDNITESAMGVSVNALEDSESEYVKAVNVISKISMNRMFNPILQNEFVFNFLPQKNAQMTALKILHDQTRKVIKERYVALQNSKSSLDELVNSDDLGIKKKSAFLDLLLLSEVNGQRLDMESIREEVDTFMFEGHDTTTSSLCFTLYCIGKHKGVDEKIMEEQRAIFGNELHREPTYRDLQQMKYLELVLKESLRLYPSVPLISRTIKKDCEIAGIKVPAETNVTLDIIHMQRDPEIFKDPLEFRPERFEDTTDKNVFSWVPFSAGSRNCIGQKFAMMELKVVISSIVKNFRIVSQDDVHTLSSDLILRSLSGVKVKMERRK